MNGLEYIRDVDETANRFCVYLEAWGKPLKNIHISIDDVIKPFRWLANNNPNSIFDMNFFKQLLKWHERYNVKFTLYLFAETENFHINEVPDKYSDEFTKCKDWMRFGYHGNSSGIPFKKEKNYEEGYKHVNSALERLGAGKTNTLRMHHWYVNDNQKKWLTSIGVSKLLYPDNNRFFKGDDFKFTQGLSFMRTRVQFENIKKATHRALHIGLPEIYAFTHEWCFEEQIQKIEDALKMYKESGYKFI